MIRHHGSDAAYHTKRRALNGITKLLAAEQNRRSRKSDSITLIGLRGALRSGPFAFNSSQSIVTWQFLANARNPPRINELGGEDLSEPSPLHCDARSPTRLPPETDSAEAPQTQNTPRFFSAGCFRINGWSEIRTHGTLSRTHAFQACALNHSAIHPEY